MSDTQDPFVANRLEKLQRIEQLGVDPWGHRFDGHQPIGEIRNLQFDATPPLRVRAAGRILQRRGQGKAIFIDIWDWSGRVQVMLGQKQIGDDGWALAQELDLGDLVGIDGTFSKTRMGELTIFADKLTFLGKSLQPHPDKWGGMQEIEYRLRHRYLDIIYTPEVLDRGLKRVKIIRRIRTFLDAQGFVEVDTPTLHAIAGGAAARPFTTHHNALDIDLFLRIALELHLKRLLVGGFEKVYEIGRVFRNEGISPKHNPEFTLMELYQAYGDYQVMMDLTEGVIVECVRTVLEHDKKDTKELKLQYGEQLVDFTPPWPRQAYSELFREHVGVAIDDQDGVRQAAQTRHIKTTGVDHDVLVHHLFEAAVEEKLTGPVFVFDYPAALCPLTKRKRGNPALAERFELYVHGMELANAYTELNDPITQEQTFRQQLAGLSEEDSMAKMDEDFVHALRHGMPPAGGLGIGIDRLIMFLTNAQTIRDVILFPLLRPQ